jgi:RNA polymerase sigma factor (sigma-70 family)
MACAMSEPTFEDAPDEPTDAALIAATRGGDTAAFGQLWDRHVEAARRLARQLTGNPADTDDLVSEAFTKVLAALEAGRGPDQAFRAYLLASVRNLRYDKARRDRKLELYPDLSEHDPGVPFVDPAVAGLERSLAARAFTSLPERWQLVLWHTEVEGETPAQVAPLLGLTANGVAALAYRARERLRQAYLQVHLDAGAEAGCEWTVERLGAYARGGASARDTGKIDTHLAGCVHCTDLLVALREVNADLPGTIAPLVLGTATAAYLKAALAGGFGGLTAWLAWLRRSQRARYAAAAGTCAAVLAAALALVPTAHHTPIRPPPKRPGHAKAQPPPANPPAQPPPEDNPPGHPAGRPPRPGTPPPAVPAAAPKPAHLTTTLDAVGELVTGHHGVLALGVLNAGPGPSGPLAAALTLPSGVTLDQPSGVVWDATHGAGFGYFRAPAANDTPVGDGWSCAGLGGTAPTCHRNTPLPAGQRTLAYLPVLVSDSADVGGKPAAVVTSNGSPAPSPATSPTAVSGGGLGAAYVTRGPATVTLAGNTLASCPATAFHCPPARLRQGPTPLWDNEAWGPLMLPYDADGDPHTFASSAATLGMPAGARVLWAGLYAGASGRPPGHPTVTVRPPGGAYTTLPLGDVQCAEPGWQGFADVTSLVDRYGGGAWWAADVRAGGYADSRYAGWGLVVVYARSGLPTRQVSVFDSLNLVTPSHPVRFALPAATGGGSASAGVVAWEGDAQLTDDQLAVGATTWDNVGRSVANGSIPSEWNTFGVDVHDGPVTLAGGTPALVGRSQQEYWLLGVLSLVE